MENKSMIHKIIIFNFCKIYNNVQVVLNLPFSAKVYLYPTTVSL